jgi:hypothetical protein
LQPLQEETPATGHVAGVSFFDRGNASPVLENSNRAASDQPKNQ